MTLDAFGRREDFPPGIGYKDRMQPKSTTLPPVWRGTDGKPVSCLEKIKVLNQNLEEIRDLCHDALEDAVLMGCDPAQIRDVLRQIVEEIEQPFASVRKDGKI